MKPVAPVIPMRMSGIRFVPMAVSSNSLPKQGGNPLSARQ
jgi:hypothetical protein